MTTCSPTRKAKASMLLPLAVLSAAWTTTLVQGEAPGELPGPAAGQLAVPAEALEQPASYSVPGSLGRGLRTGSRDQVIRTASTNGIPTAALSAYQRAETVMTGADKSCDVPWQLIAAIGRVESDHGRYGGNTLGTDGVSRPGIYGIALNGKNKTRAISDTDAGLYDKDVVWDRAVGPMQFIPSTWSVVGVDADGDAKRNPQDIDDAALAAAVYLCSGDDDLDTESGRRTAVFRYNHSDEYVDLVLSIMDAYTVGDYTSVPNYVTSAVTFTPARNYVRSSGTRTRAEHGTKNPSAGTTDGGGTEAPTTPSVPGPPKSAADPDDLQATIKKVTDKTVVSLAETLTRAEAQARCLAEGISLLSLARLTTCINDLLLP